MVRDSTTRAYLRNQNLVSQWRASSEETPKSVQERTTHDQTIHSLFRGQWWERDTTWEGATITPTEEEPARSVYIRTRSSKVDLVKKGGMSTEGKLTESIPLPDQTLGTRQYSLPLSCEVGNLRVREPLRFSHCL